MDRYDFILFDFDDTLWARDIEDIRCSEYNIKFIYKYLFDKSIIISGNSFKSIKSKLDSINIVMPAIWAEANSCFFKNNTYLYSLKECEIKDSDKIISFIKNDLKLDYTILERDNKIFNIKLKPIYSDRDRIELVDIINHEFKNFNCIARKTGNTTVDILSENNSKKLIYNQAGFDIYKTLYIGDEIYEGNDKELANLCTRKISVKNVYETKALLDCFGRRNI